MSNAQTARLLGALYTVGLFGTLAAGGAWLWLLLSTTHVNGGGRAWLAGLFALAVMALFAAVGARFAMQRFYDSVCSAALRAWRSNPGYDTGIDAELLAELAGLPKGFAWHARQYLERTAKAAGITYQAGPKTPPNLRRYLFRRRLDR